MVVIVADFMVNKKVVLENGVVDPSMFNVLFAMAWRGVLWRGVRRQASASFSCAVSCGWMENGGRGFVSWGQKVLR